MIRGHSMSIYNLAINARYRMGDFENIKYSKKFDCHYSGNDGYHFKKVYIDTELSTAFRFEKWIDEVCYILELPMISYSCYFGKKDINAFNVECKATILKNNEYREFRIHLKDYVNFPLKSGSWTQLYMLEHGKNVFDMHKDRLIELLSSMGDKNEYRNISPVLDIMIYERMFASDSLHC